jgi:hypothetical protein
VQILGKPADEATILAIASQLEGVSSFTQTVPTLFA